MTTFFHLLKLQLDNSTDLFKATSPKKVMMTVMKAVLVLLALTVLVALLCFRIFFLGVGVTAELLAIILLVTQLISLVFASGHIISTLYLSRDNEMLIFLPASSNQLFFSRLTMIYLREIAVNATIILPLFLTLGLFGGMPTSFYLSIPLFLLVLPLLPLVLASLISVPATALLRFFKRHTALATLTLLVSVAAILWGYIYLVGFLAGEFDIANAQNETVAEINRGIAGFGARIPLYFALGQALISPSKLYHVAIFLGVCGVLATLTVFLIRPFYFKNAMTSLENSQKGKPRCGKFRERSPFMSLLHREILCLFRSPSDVFQYFLFTLLMPFIVFSYDNLLSSLTVNQAGVNMIAGTHVMVVTILAMLSNLVSASAISREGENFYNSKIAPVGYFSQILAKFTFNAIFTLTALVVTAVISSFRYPVWQIALGTLATALAAVGHIALGIDMDIKNPSVYHKGDEPGVSKSTPKSLLVGLLIGFALGMTVILLSGMENAYIPYLIIIGASLVFALYRVYMLVLRIERQYDRIEL